MKVILFLLFFTPLAIFAQNEPLHNLKEVACVTGKISYFQYDSDNTISIQVGMYNLYTSRTTSFPFIFEAFAKQMRVLIFTASCHNGGGFSKIQIYPAGS